MGEVPADGVLQTVVVAMNAPLRANGDQNPAARIRFEEGTYKIKYRWILDMVGFNVPAPPQGGGNQLASLPELIEGEFNGEVEVDMEVYCHGEGSLKVWLAVLDKDNVLTNFRNFCGEGKFSIGVEIMYLNRSLVFPRMYWEDENPLDAPILNEIVEHQEISLFRAMELASNQIQLDSFKATIKLQYEGEESDDEEEGDA